MSIRTVLAHLAPLARQMRASIMPGGGDPALLFNAIVEAGLLVAAADGTIDKTELSTLKAGIRALTEDQLSVEEVGMLVQDMLELRTIDGEDARCKAVGEVLASSHAAEEGIFLAAAIAYVSGGLDRREMNVLEKIAAPARLSPEALAGIVTGVRDEIARRSIVGIA